MAASRAMFMAAADVVVMGFHVAHEGSPVQRRFGG